MRQVGAPSRGQCRLPRDTAAPSAIVPFHLFGLPISKDAPNIPGGSHLKGAAPCGRPSSFPASVTPDETAAPHRRSGEARSVLGGRTGEGDRIYPPRSGQPVLRPQEPDAVSRLALLQSPPPILRFAYVNGMWQSHRPGRWLRASGPAKLPGPRWRADRRNRPITTSGVVLLGQVAAHLTVLDVACNRCDRRGKVKTARLVAEHGAAMAVPDLLRIIAADCPRMRAGRTHEPCGVHLPGLVALGL
jgi:hypothetical protein